MVGDVVSLHAEGGRVFRGTLHLLQILSMFSAPRTLQGGLSELAGGNSRLDWIESSAILLKLVEARILVADNPRASSVHFKPEGFAQAAVHITMLNDRNRTETYLNALRREVKPGQVVVDLGTGTGILATAAAKYGAGRVYAIEAGGIASVARSMFAANEVDDVVTLVEGRSTRVELPEKADLIVSEIIGSEPLAERALEYTLDALRRFAKPGAQFLPKRLRILAQPLELPESELELHVFTRATTARWRRWYGLDFDVLLDATSPIPYRFAVDPARASDWTCLGEPEPLVEIDFETLTTDTLDVRQRFETNRSGVINAIGIYFDLMLTDEHTITTRPSVAAPDTSWNVTVSLVDPPFSVGPQTAFELHYRHSPTATTLHCAKI